MAELVDTGVTFADVVTMPKTLACMEHVIGLGCELSSLNAGSTNPHNPMRSRGTQTPALSPTSVVTRCALRLDAQ